MEVNRSQAVLRAVQDPACTPGKTPVVLGAKRVPDLPSPRWGPAGRDRRSLIHIQKFSSSRLSSVLVT